MRAILFILILGVVALIAAIATGLVNINQTQPARVPDIAASGKGVTATGGQAPAFDVETGSVSIGAQQRNLTVAVPTVGVNPANEAQPQSNEALPAQR